MTSNLFLAGGEALGVDHDHYTAVYKRMNVVPFDRFGANPPCLGYTLHPFSDYRPKYSDIKFGDACMKRAHEIIDMGRPIRLFWSGGIDSTTVLVALIKAGIKADQLQIACNADSICERWQFFRKHVSGKYEITPSTSVAESVLDHGVLTVTGELADQCFGADIMMYPAALFGGGILRQRASVDLWIDLQAHCMMMPPEMSARYYDELIASAAFCDVQLNEMFDLYWWGNFAFKWQDVALRSIALSSPEHSQHIKERHVFNNMCHFFQAGDFQDWSITRRQPKIDVEWRTYKRVAKEFIYEFEQDEVFLHQGIKVQSMANIWQSHRMRDDNLVLFADPWGFSVERPELTYSDTAAADFFCKEDRSYPEKYALKGAA